MGAWWVRRRTIQHATGNLHVLEAKRPHHLAGGQAQGGDDSDCGEHPVRMRSRSRSSKQAITKGIGIQMPSRRHLLFIAGAALGLTPALGYLGSPGARENQMTTATRFPVQKTDDQWRATLSPEQYSSAARARHGAGVHQPSEQREASGHVRLRGLRSAAIQLGYQVRQRHRMAELLQAARGRRWNRHRSELARGSHRSELRALRRTPGARVPRWSASDRAALLHERGGDEVRADAMSGDRRRDHQTLEEEWPRRSRTSLLLTAIP